MKARTPEDNWELDASCLDGMQKPSRRMTFAALYAVCLVEGADSQLLPSSFLALESNLGLTPKDLATMSLCQALVSSLTAPIWGVFIDHGCSAKLLMACGAFGWGALTIALAFLNSVPAIMCLRMLNGLALATLTPVSQTVIADLTQPGERGRYFAWTDFSRNFGRLLGGFFTTAVSRQMVLGMQGWRVAFMVVGVASITLAWFIAIAMPEHRKPWSETSLSEELAAFRGYFRVGSFVVIVVQGCFGSVPWSALAFITMYFQYAGLPDGMAALVTSVKVVASAFGSVLGGEVGDQFAKRSRFHGRPLAAQISVLCGIPTVIVILSAGQYLSSHVALLCLLCIFFGLTASWCGSGVNRPILTEVVSPKHHARVISWCSALEGSCAACLGSPVVAFLAQSVFHYQAQTRPLSEVPHDLRMQNMHALATGVAR